MTIYYLQRLYGPPTLLVFWSAVLFALFMFWLFGIVAPKLEKKEKARQEAIKQEREKKREESVGESCDKEEK